MHKFALELIQAGFQPDSLKTLQEKIRYIVIQTIASIVEKFQIPLLQSLSGFIVPGVSYFIGGGIIA